MHILASLSDAPQFLARALHFRDTEDLKWSPEATWMSQFIAPALLKKRASHFWTQVILVRWANLILCLFLNQTQTITTLERVTDNESVKSMFSCSILYVTKGSSRQNISETFISKMRCTTLCLPSLKSILLPPQHKVTVIHQQMTLFKSVSVLNCYGLQNKHL